MIEAAAWVIVGFAGTVGVLGTVFGVLATRYACREASRGGCRGGNCRRRPADSFPSPAESGGGIFTPEEIRQLGRRFR